MSWSVDIDGIVKEFTRDQLTKQLSLRDKAMQGMIFEKKIIGNF